MQPSFDADSRSAPEPTQPYGSAGDLPTVQTLRTQLAEMRALARVVPGVDTSQLDATERGIHQLVRVVDGFYALLGPRRWVFTDDLNVSEMGKIVAESPDATDAERRLIAYYQQDTPLDVAVARLHRFPAMKPRLTLVDKAKRDYREGRYYSTVLVLLAVMDGFVQDITEHDAQRRNLTTTEAQELVAWDSVAGHHMGLSNAHDTFWRAFKKTRSEPTTELFRNGIMHGMLVDFDNDVVATKAWNRLFAVTDWATGRDKKSRPSVPEPTIEDVVAKYIEVQADRARLEEWLPHGHTLATDETQWSNLDRTCVQFLDDWQHRRWGLLAEHLWAPTTGTNRRTNKGHVADVRRTYSRFPLSKWTINRVNHKGASMAMVTADLAIDGNERIATLRWLYTDLSGEQIYDWQADGVWRLATHSPDQFFNRQDS